MKTTLTPEQSQRLIELGVDPSKASEKVKVYEAFTAGFRWESKVPIFNFADTFSLLPKEIDGIGLGMEYGDKLWCVYYNTLIVKSDYELIDALFELLCWVLKNHPDKIKRL